MCIVCVEFQKQLLSVNEARNIVVEMISTIDTDHLIDVLEMLGEAEDKEVNGSS